MKLIVKLAVASIVLSPTLSIADEISNNSQLSLSTGANYNTGSYGSNSDTNILYVPFALKYKTDKWSTKITIPYIQIEGSGSVRPNLGSVTTAGNTRTTESDLGDVVLAGTYSFYQNEDSGLFADLTGKVKFGTADTKKNLGTGETDYTIELDVMKLMGNFTPMAGIGYKILGDSSTLTLRDVWMYNIGMDYKVNEGLNFGAFYDWREKATSTSINQQDLTLYMSYRINKEVKVQPYVGAGLSDGSPNVSTGFSFTYSY